MLTIPYTTDYRNNVICKRTIYIQTKHHMNFHYLISQNMLQEGLEHDQFTVNQMWNKATKVDWAAALPNILIWIDRIALKQY